MPESEVLVIGAGPAGLAAAGALRMAGIPFEILEKDTAVGATWRRHYDRLHLHTVRRHSSLPGLPMPADWPRYPSRDQVVSYLEAYQAHHAITPRFGTTVRRAGWDGRWKVETGGDTWTARHLVVATGYNTAPHRPSFPGIERFRGQVLHSSEYRNGAAWRGRRALVVGCGNSGGELVIDLHEHGAEVAWGIRGPVHVTPRDLFGRGIQETSILLSGLPVSLADRIAVTVQKLVVGDLSRFGIVRPDRGPLDLVWNDGRVSIIDIGTIALVRAGAVTVVPGIAEVTEDAVRFEDGRVLPLDLVVLATGYRTRLDFLDGHEALVNARGVPRFHGEEAPPGGLWFIGYRNPPTGALREMALEAERIARGIYGAATPGVPPAITSTRATAPS